MRTVTNTAAAVNTEFVDDMCLPVMYPDGLCGAVFDAVDAALTGGLFQTDRTHELIFFCVVFFHVIPPCFCKAATFQPAEAALSAKCSLPNSAG